MRFQILACVSCFLLVECQENSLTRVVLTGEPRVIARRIIRTDLKTAQNLVQADDHQHSTRVNIVDPADVQYQTGQGTPVKVYSRVLRPARLTWTGDSVITDNWTGSDAQSEIQSFTQNQRPSVITTIVQPAH